jgi:hypothetical protein
LAISLFLHTYTQAYSTPFAYYDTNTITHVWVKNIASDIFYAVDLLVDPSPIATANEYLG